MCPPIGCFQDGGDRTVLPQEHGGSDATDVVRTDLKLKAGSSRGQTWLLDGVLEAEGDCSL